MYKYLQVCIYIYAYIQTCLYMLMPLCISNHPLDVGTLFETYRLLLTPPSFSSTTSLNITPLHINSLNIWSRCIGKA